MSDADERSDDALCACGHHLGDHHEGGVCTMPVGDNACGCTSFTCPECDDSGVIEGRCMVIDSMEYGAWGEWPCPNCYPENYKR